MILFLDGFGHYATADLEKKWTAAGATAVTWSIAAEGRVANCVKRVSTANTDTPGALTFAPLLTQAGVWTPTISGTFGCALKVDDLNAITVGQTPSVGIFTIGNAFFTLASGAQDLFGVMLNSNGTFSLIRQSGLSTWDIEANSVQGITEGVWAYVEFQWALSTDDATADGTFKIRVNGTQVLNYTGVLMPADLLGFPTPAREWTSIRVLGTRSSASPLLTMRMCDVYLADRAGGVNDDFLGDVSIDYIKPNGVGNAGSWTNSGAGANWEDVDDATPNDDTDYIEASAAGTRDSYAFEDVVGNPLAIQIVASVRKTAASAATVTPITRHSGADNDGVAQGVGDESYEYILWPQDENPGTAAPWTEAQLNAAEFGLEKTS